MKRRKWTSSMKALILIEVYIKLRTLKGLMRTFFLSWRWAGLRLPFAWLDSVLLHPAAPTAR